MHTAILVQSRMSSSRLPGKALMKIGGCPLIYYVVKRLERIGLPITVCTSVDESDDVLVNYLEQQNINVYRGSLNNVLKRFLDAAEKKGITQFFRITGDNAFVDVDYILENYDKIISYDYTDGIHGEGFLYGIGFEFVKVKELKKIVATDTFYLENVTSYLREHMQKSYHRLIPKDYRKINKQVFLSCDFLEDFTLVSLLLTLYNFRIDISTLEILNIFDQYPGIYKINQDKHQIPNY